MGGSSSRPRPLPLLVEEPWLQMNWEDRESDLQFINNYKPKGEGQEKFRILLHGPVGAGKSSFINSVISILESRICRRATACNTGQGSFTREYQSYRIKKGNQDNEYPFVLNDMMGLSNVSRRYRRVHVKDMKKVMKGHIKDGYKFNPESTLSNTDPFYKQKPTINDKVHILVSVFDANTANLLGNSVVETIQDIRDDATELGIPHVVVLTKIDEVCPETKKDVKNACKSKLLQEKVKDFSKLIGIPENCIFPVKNYHCEKKLNHDIDALIMNTLRHIIEIGEDKLGR
ncbi:PREDICTED: interferon-induced protein 44-like [Poecilia mexicana]|uniref:Uncharacterized protein n=1 Tax=Poecilia mexicana TaxID=48701 RepID=A0A3B3XLY6_9TELE|nr:PREDICTED: interferon-induced protein 44-like [Poecilia mexicana]